MSETCETCARFEGMMCRRLKRFSDGTTLALAIPKATERDERHAAHKTINRYKLDVCGKAGKHWVAK